MIDTKRGEDMGYIDWDSISEEEKKEILSGKDPSEKQIQYAKAIAEALDIKLPKGDAYVIHKFISKNKQKYNERWDKQSAKTFLIDSVNLCVPITQEDINEWYDLIGEKKGVYAFLGLNDEILYIGKSSNLFSRIPSSFNERREKEPIKTIAYYIVDNMADTHILEMVLIEENKPKLNTDGICEEYPKMFHSGLDVLKDFKRLPCDFSEPEHIKGEDEIKQIEAHNKKKTNVLKLPKNTLSKKSWKSVYWLETEEGYVKIGISNDISRRIKEIEKEYKVKVKRIRFTKISNAAKLIEDALHDIFVDNWVGGLYGEWFDVDYSEVNYIAENLMYLISQQENYREPTLNTYPCSLDQYDKLYYTGKDMQCEISTSFGIQYEALAIKNQGKYKERFQKEAEELNMNENKHLGQRYELRR